jgi:hypothetical protein
MWSTYQSADIASSLRNLSMVITTSSIGIAIAQSSERPGQRIKISQKLR